MLKMPLWKEHFPISLVDDHFVTRREFTKSLVWVSVGTFLANAVLAMLSQFKPRWAGRPLPQVAVARQHELAIGDSKIFHYPGADDPCLLLRLDAERYVAFGQQCTHLGCPVHYRAAAQCIYCPCHEGYFHPEDGRVLAGPPARPLPRIAVETRGEQIWAVGKLS
ncbi:MAG: ubiquinol-cytochrome c reductase iron-sulfur subunit [Candidatus Tectimicrobiota bacterium]